MGDVITGRDLAMFIIKFSLMDAAINTEVDIPGGGIEFNNFGLHDETYTLYSDGKYIIDEYDRTENQHYVIGEGNMFDDFR